MSDERGRLTASPVWGRCEDEERPLSWYGRGRYRSAMWKSESQVCVEEVIVVSGKVVVVV